MLNFFPIEVTGFTVYPGCGLIKWFVLYSVILLDFPTDLTCGDSFLTNASNYAEDPGTSSHIPEHSQSFIYRNCGTFNSIVSLMVISYIILNFNCYSK